MPENNSTPPINQSESPTTAKPAVSAVNNPLPSTVPKPLQLEIFNKAPCVSTLDIAEHTGLSHRGIIRLVRKYKTEFESAGQVNFKSSLNTQGSATQYVLLNKAQFIALGNLWRNTPEIVKFKFNLATTFMRMEAFIVEWIESRNNGKPVTVAMTAAYKAAWDYENMPESYADDDTNRPKPPVWLYPNLQQAIFKAALGRTYQSIKAERNIQPGGNIRDGLTVDEYANELYKLTSVQDLALTLLADYDKTNQVTGRTPCPALPIDVLQCIKVAGDMLGYPPAPINRPKKDAADAVAVPLVENSINVQLLKYDNDNPGVIEAQTWGIINGVVPE